MIATDPNATCQHGSVNSVFAESRRAQGRWATQPLRKRLRLIRRARELIAENARELARASAEMRDRPLSESLTAEVLPLVEACRFLERNATRILATTRFGCD